MMGRERRYRNGKVSLKTRVGIATALVVGGTAIGVAAVAATSHGSPTAAKSDAFSSPVKGITSSEGVTLGSALADWNKARQTSYAQLAGLTQARGFSESSDKGQTLDVQRGIVVFARQQFVILQSANGTLHLWLLSGKTQFQNVTKTAAGTAAMTASSSAAQQIIASGDMIPATTLMAGSPLTAETLLSSLTRPQTVTVQVAGTDLTVTVTVTKSAGVGVADRHHARERHSRAGDPVAFSQGAWQRANSMARGDLAMIAGNRAHGTLHAQVVLFSPLSTLDVSGRPDPR